MKKFVLFIILAVMAVVGSESHADGQYVVKTDSASIIVADNNGDDVVNIFNYDDNKLNIRVAGVEIVIGEGRQQRHRDEDSGTPRKPDKGKHGGRHSDEQTKITMWGRNTYQALLEVGVNMLPSPDYSLYDGMDLDVPSDFMVLNNMKSLQWAISVADGSIAFNRSRNLSLSFGMQLVLDDYTFGEQLKFVKEGGMLIPQMIDSSYKKSKINTLSIKVPLMFNVGIGRSLHFSAGVYGGVLLGAHTKIKFPKEKMYDPYMAPFYYGLSARFGFKSCYIYANYGLSNMFKKNHGPVVAPVTIGLGLIN